MSDRKSETTANVADPSKETTITCFMAAICRDLTEGGNGYRYFGSLGAWTTHQRQAIRAGLLTADGNLTAVAGVLLTRAGGEDEKGRFPQP